MKNSLSLILKVLVSGVLLYLIIIKIDWNQLLDSIKKVNLYYLTISLFFGIIFNMIKFLKWRNLIKTINSSHSYWDGAKSYMIGNSMGLVTPMRAGDLGRALYFPTGERTTIMGLTIIDRLIDLVIVLILSIMGSFVLIKNGLGLLVVFLAISGILILYNPKFLYEISIKIIPDNYVGKKLSKLIDTLKFLDIQNITTALILSFFAFLVTIIQFYCLVSAFENISFISVCLTTPLITLSAVLPVSIMGLGVREGTSILLFSIFGVSAATAGTAAFLCFVTNNVSISIIGIVFLSKIKMMSKKTGLQD